MKNILIIFVIALILQVGKDMVISGFKNKVQVALVNITPDSIQGAQMEKVQRPASDKQK
ncbi:MAG: hypothetical protein ABWZ79_04770 [Pedobacter agri]